jgi:hypothetical protein
MSPIIIIFILFQVQITNEKKTYVAIPITHKKPSDSTFYSDLLSNPAYAKLKIGTPSQELNIRLSLKYCPFSLSGSETSITDKKYDKSKSNTYKNLGGDKPKNIYFESFTSYFNSSETMYFGSEKYENIKFNYAYENNPKVNESGILGLLLRDTNLELLDFNLIRHLKKQDLTTSYSFFFNYKNDYEGELIIGNYPHEYDSSNYIEDNKVFETVQIDDYEHININVKAIKYGDTNILEGKNAHITFERGLSYGSENYKKEILKDFFQKYLDNKKCTKHDIDSSFETFVCDSSVNIKDLKTLNFTVESKDGSNLINFLFTYEDLFQKINGKWYFLVYFSKNFEMNLFEIGRIFFKKYIAAIDQDKKIINFYKKKESNFGHIIVWIFVFICILIIGGLLFYIYKTRFFKRKLRANELEDNYEYLSKDNNEAKNKLLN